MGHKGVSKRKPNKTKSAPLSNDKAGSGVASALMTTESHPGKNTDSGKATPVTKDGVKSSSQSKKKCK